MMLLLKVYSDAAPATTLAINGPVAGLEYHFLAHEQLQSYKIYTYPQGDLPCKSKSPGALFLKTLRLADTMRQFVGLLRLAT
jgi:hypothetical protein